MKQAGGLASELPQARLALRNIALAQLAPLLALPAQWHSLQKEVPETDREALTQLPIADHGAALRDFSDTAALIAELDLIISVDTASAHLAGAMGKPVWILLPETADFRWPLERADSPWYPTARLFRQTAHADWGAPLEALGAALGEWIAAFAARH
ncbi:MAG: hypothetical protein MO847_01720 [Candidatus Protistobacter heckmanni]|nr:hypothetical protein [Candidatus Protistobacter heckmanni]